MALRCSGKGKARGDAVEGARPLLAFDQEVSNEGKRDPGYVRGRTCFCAGVPDVAHRGVHKVVRYTKYGEDWDGKAYAYWECLKNWPEEFSIDKALSGGYLRGRLHWGLSTSRTGAYSKFMRAYSEAYSLRKAEFARSVGVLVPGERWVEASNYGGTP